jgi:5-methylcytosine-specific restriction endonuclease McrA
MQHARMRQATPCARGLCSTHYNQANVKQVEAECAACGERVSRRTNGREPAIGRCARRNAGPTYRTADGRRAQFQRATLLAPSSAGCRHHMPAATRRARLDCGWCETRFTARRWVDQYCNKRCKAKASRVRRAARESDGHTYSWAQVMRTFALLDYRCAYCGEKPDGPPDPDHVVPLSRHGSNGNGNILPSCRPCNSDKRDLLLHEWAVDRARLGKPPVRTTIDRHLPAFAHLLPDAVSSSSGTHIAA